MNALHPHRSSRALLAAVFATAFHVSRRICSDAARDACRRIRATRGIRGSRHPRHSRSESAAVLVAADGACHHARTGSWRGLCGMGVEETSKPSREITARDRARAPRKRPRTHARRGSRDFRSRSQGSCVSTSKNAFGIIATHLTTHEFLTELLQSSHGAVAKNRPLLADFLESCDLAKFGGWNLTIPAMNDMFQSASRFVVESAAARLQQGASNSPAPSSTSITSDTYDSLSTT